MRAGLRLCEHMLRHVNPIESLFQLQTNKLPFGQKIAVNPDPHGIHLRRAAFK
jgi:hypothetical protein